MLNTIAHSVTDTTPNIYLAKVFGGDEHPCTVGDDAPVPRQLNETFLSINVGGAAEVTGITHVSTSSS